MNHLDAMVGESNFSLFDMEEFRAILNGEGSWYHANLARALHILLPNADWKHQARLRSAYPNEVAFYEAWYNGRQLPLINAQREREGLPTLAQLPN